MTLQWKKAKHAGIKAKTENGTFFVRHIGAALPTGGVAKRWETACILRTVLENGSIIIQRPLYLSLNEHEAVRIAERLADGLDPLPQPPKD